MQQQIDMLVQLQQRQLALQQLQLQVAAAVAADADQGRRPSPPRGRGRTPPAPAKVLHSTGTSPLREAARVQPAPPASRSPAPSPPAAAVSPDVFERLVLQDIMQPRPLGATAPQTCHDSLLAEALELSLNLNSSSSAYY